MSHTPSCSPRSGRTVRHNPDPPTGRGGRSAAAGSAAGKSDKPGLGVYLAGAGALGLLAYFVLRPSPARAAPLPAGTRTVPTPALTRVGTGSPRGSTERTPITERQNIGPVQAAAVAPADLGNFRERPVLATAQHQLMVLDQWSGTPIPGMNSAVTPLVVDGTWGPATARAMAGYMRSRNINGASDQLERATSASVMASANAAQRAAVASLLNAINTEFLARQAAMVTAYDAWAAQNLGIPNARGGLNQF